MLRLGRLTRWSLGDLMSLTFDEAEWWLEGAQAQEAELINLLGS